MVVWLSLEFDLPGILNEGLVSTHELKYGCRLRKDWIEAVKKSKGILQCSNKSLPTLLGFKRKRIDNLNNWISEVMIKYPPIKA